MRKKNSSCYIIINSNTLKKKTNELNESTAEFKKQIKKTNAKQNPRSKTY